MPAPAAFLCCLQASLLLGAGIAAAYMFRSRYTKSFVVTLALLPAIVQMVIMLVNGNLGAGVAVMGAFSLVRFRSVPGSAREIGSLFLAMAVGLATGMGYIGLAVLFTLILTAVGLLYTVTRFGENKRCEKELKVTIPESLDYSGIFDDLFETYTARAELRSVRTTQMGSLYQLHYRIVLKEAAREKELLDAIRCRNGNLDILCGRVPANAVEEL
ncbi:MAG: DUF4956 domain-containing protein [Clostridiales bacterium]|nr:DUF4956 domain-containing protein [Clostridiales bacterium]